MADPWQRRDRGDVLITRIFTVEKQALVHPRSGDAHDFYIVRAPDWCNVVPLTRDGHVVMVRQRRHGIEAETLELPGGMVSVFIPLSVGTSTFAPRTASPTVIGTSTERFRPSRVK